MKLFSRVSSVAVTLLIITFFNVPAPLRFPKRMKQRLNARHGYVSLSIATWSMTPPSTISRASPISMMVSVSHPSSVERGGILAARTVCAIRSC